MACKSCEWWRETLPGLMQCTNPKSTRYNDDTGASSTCEPGGYKKVIVDGDDWELIRSRIKEALADANMTAKELSELTSVTYQSIWQTITGRTTPRLITIMEIARGLNVSIDWLCGMRESRG